MRLLLFAALPLAVGGLLLARLAPAFLLEIAHCPQREMTGVPCPTCGGTLALTRLAAGDVAAAWAANPLVLGLVIGGLVAALWATVTTLVPAWRRSLDLAAGQRKTAVVAAVVLVIVNWVVLALRR